jgi:hypothetical protein
MSRRIVFLLFLFFAITFVQAQKKIGFELVFKPKIDYRSIQYAEGSTYYMDYRKHHETNSLSCDFGLLINYSIRENLIFRTGIVRSVRGYSTDEEFLADSCYTSPNCEFRTGQYQYQFYYLHIPLHLMFTHSYQKVKLVLNTGISANYLYKTNVKYTLRKDLHESAGKSETNTKNTSTLNPVDIGFDFGLGVSYPLTTHLSALVMPELNLQLSNFRNSDIRNRVYNKAIFDGTDKSNKERLFSVGFSVNLIYTL